jgi:hypothetical protein
VCADLECNHNDLTFSLAVPIEDKSVKKFVFRAPSPSVFNTWVGMLKIHLEKSRRQVEFKYVASNVFWKIGCISNSELVTSAQTGDLILFRGKGMNNWMLRASTFSKYDHVAIIIKYKSGQLVLFESLQGKGVCRWDWKHLVSTGYWKKNYENICYRKLVGVERDDEFNKKVFDFIAETEGMPYILTTNSLF